MSLLRACLTLVSSRVVQNVKQCPRNASTGGNLSRLAHPGDSVPTAAAAPDVRRVAVAPPPPVIEQRARLVDNARPCSARCLTAGAALAGPREI